MSEPTPPPDARLDAAMARVLAQHGAHLPAAAEVRLRENVRALLASIDALRNTPLINADEPDPVFRVYRADAP